MNILIYIADILCGECLIIKDKKGQNSIYVLVKDYKKYNLESCTLKKVLDQENISRDIYLDKVYFEETNYLKELPRWCPDRYKNISKNDLIFRFDSSIRYNSNYRLYFRIKHCIDDMYSDCIKVSEDKTYQKYDIYVKRSQVELIEKNKKYYK